MFLPLHLLGATGYLRKFIYNYAKIVEPLTRLLNEKVDFVWGKKQDNALTLLKAQLTQAIILVKPD